METFLKGVGVSVVLVIVLFLFSALFAFPTKWVVNYLINPTLLATIFTTGKFTFWHAWAFNLLTATAFKTTSVNSKS